MVDSRESLYAALYARRILVDPGPDPLDACHLECFFFYILFLFTCGWILVDPDEVREEDPVQWIMGIMTLLMLHYRLQSSSTGYTAYSIWEWLFAERLCT